MIAFKVKLGMLWVDQLEIRVSFTLKPNRSMTFLFQTNTIRVILINTLTLPSFIMDMTS